ncbi:MAG: hypothetical protein IE916_02425 [Epsilonproteobacteria bacterium]|nr:hypothetical protein [Campylobacterota bacterium]
MCIPHGMAATTSNGFEKKERPKKHIERVSKEIFEKGDPNFVDERINKEEPQEEKKGFLASIFSSTH